MTGRDSDMIVVFNIDPKHKAIVQYIVKVCARRKSLPSGSVVFLKCCKKTNKRSCIVNFVAVPKRRTWISYQDSAL